VLLQHLSKSRDSDLMSEDGNSDHQIISQTALTQPGAIFNLSRAQISASNISGSQDEVEDAE
jgi:hypothetical protein